MKYIIPVIVFLISGPVWAKCEKTLTWSHSLTTPQSTEKAADGLFDISDEIVDVVLKKAGCEYSHIINSWARSLRAIKTGQADFVVSASKNKERENWGWFTEPYYIETIVLFYNQGDLRIPKFLSLTDALEKGFRIGVGSEKYWVGEEFDQIKKSGKYIDQLVFANNLDAEASIFKMLTKKYVDLIIAAKYSGSSLAK